MKQKSRIICGYLMQWKHEIDRRNIVLAWLWVSYARKMYGIYRELSIAGEIGIYQGSFVKHSRNPGCGITAE